MKYVIQFYLIVFFHTSYCQTSNSTHHEMDILYQKYKDKDSITVSTPYGEINGAVKVFKNRNEKASRFEVTGMSDNKEAVINFLIQAITIKKNKGYTSANSIDKSPYTLLNQSTLPVSLELFKNDMFFVIQLDYCESLDINKEGKVSLKKDYDFFHFVISTGYKSGHGEKVIERFDF